LTGANTDTTGFRRLLADEGGVSLTDTDVVLLGAGGAARAVALVALRDGARSLVVANRHVQRATDLLEDLTPANLRTATGVVPLASDDLAKALEGGPVVINATSVGLAADQTPIDPSLLVEGSTVVDLIYNPRETTFLRGARRQGARTLGGLGMLVYQAAAAFERWTGIAAPADVMRAAAEADLQIRGAH
jgi:shikimate dehydrogenase